MHRILNPLALCLLCLLALSARAEDAAKPAPAREVPTKFVVQHALAGCSHCTFKATKQCMPAVKLGDTVYVVKVDEKASDTTKKLVASLAEMKDPAKHVVIKGKPMDEKKAEALGGETKFYYEIGEMSVE